MMNRKKSYLALILTLFYLFSFLLTVPTASAEEQKPVEIDYKVVRTYPHDTKSFTQGLEFYNGYLYEGTGLYGRSSLQKINLETAEVLKKRNLNDEFFGEGITILNKRIYQLTWKNNKMFVYDQDFNLIKTHNYSGEGWGLSNDGKNLIMSDGSEYIYFRDPETLKVKKRIKIYFEDQALKNINELEYINGYIYANIWGEDIIVKIDTASESVTAYLNLENLLDKNKYDDINVLNGIAYLKDRDHLLVTGKLWPKIFEIKLLY